MLLIGYRARKALAGRVSRWHKEHLIKLKLHAGIFRSDEVAIVDRIKGAAHDAKASLGDNALKRIFLLNNLRESCVLGATHEPGHIHE